MEIFGKVWKSMEIVEKSFEVFLEKTRLGGEELGIWKNYFPKVRTHHKNWLCFAFFVF
jgi:hypothetical protein